MAWSCTKTNKGLTLEAKTVAGATISFTKCVSGSGTVPVVNLKDQTAVTSIKQTLSMEEVKVNENKFSIKSLLDNTSLSTGYNLYQLGFYATDPQEGEILFAIAQSDVSKPIPSQTDSPGYLVEFTSTFENSTDANIEINLNTSGFVTIGTVLDMIDDTVELGTDITE